MKRTNGNKRSGRKRLAPTLACFKSRITNGTALLHDVDGRSASMRRLRDIINNHTADLGGSGEMSEAQLAILRRASALQLQLEMMESKFAIREDGVATNDELAAYGRSANSLRRLLESLFSLPLGRKSRDLNPHGVTLDHLIDDVVKRPRAL